MGFYTYYISSFQSRIEHMEHDGAVPFWGVSNKLNLHVLFCSISDMRKKCLVFNYIHVIFGRHWKRYFKLPPLCFKVWVYSFVCKSFCDRVRCHADAGESNFCILVPRKEKYREDRWRLGEQIRTRPSSSTPSLFFKLIYFLLKDNCFTEFCCFLSNLFFFLFFLSNLNMNQP